MATDTLVLVNEPSRYSCRILNTDASAGEAAVTKIDKSTLTALDGQEPKALDILHLQWSVSEGMSVTLLWEAGTDDEIAILSGSDEKYYWHDGPLRDPITATHVGDILLTTQGHGTAGEPDTYSILIECVKRRGD